RTEVHYKDRTWHLRLLRRASCLPLSSQVSHATPWSHTFRYMDTITPEPRPAWIAGRPEQGEGTLLVSHPFDGSEVATVAVPGPEQVERAVSAAAAIAPEFRRLPAHVRAEALAHVSRGLAGRAEELAEVITAENGKPFKW